MITTPSMEGEFVGCERNQVIGTGQSPARIKAPPQRRRALIHVESTETQDYVSEQEGLEVM